MEILTDLSALVPPQHRGTIALITVGIMVLGRAFQAVKAGGGLIGIWQALLYGTNTPKDK